MTTIKICGITQEEDALYCAKMQIDFIGLNLWPESPRSVTVGRAAEIVQKVRTRSNAPQIVLLDVSPTREDLIYAADVIQPDWLQIHGELPSGVIFKRDRSIFVTTEGRTIPLLKPFSVGCQEDVDEVNKWQADLILIDAKVHGMFGGTGQQVDSKLLEGIRHRFILAGGLTPENVGAVIAKYNPVGIDVASGVEFEPGKKSHNAIRDLKKAVGQRLPGA
ncbi:MAG: phosphoribosylanthranilate isomerase, partial [Candidatus Lindowbacteria bacterium]|nr:phosphoribosylanthranilate isomerase [Candidatus Lindowbacteria bacterium]